MSARLLYRLCRRCRIHGCRDRLERDLDAPLATRRLRIGIGGCGALRPRRRRGRDQPPRGRRAPVGEHEIRPGDVGDLLAIARRGQDLESTLQRGSPDVGSTRLDLTPARHRGGAAPGRTTSVSRRRGGPVSSAPWSMKMPPFQIVRQVSSPSPRITRQTSSPPLTSSHACRAPLPRRKASQRSRLSPIGSNACPSTQTYDIFRKAANAGCGGTTPARASPGSVTNRAARAVATARQSSPGVRPPPPRRIAP